MYFRKLYVLGLLMLLSFSASAMPPFISLEEVVFTLLGNYELDHDNLPYSTKGPTEALRSLKEYMDNHMSGGFYSHIGVVFYRRDELAEQYPFLSDSPAIKFDWLNEPNMSLQAHDSTIILVSNDYKDTLQLRCFTKGGQFFSLELYPKARTELPGMVGRSVTELVPYTAKVLDVQVFDPLAQFINWEEDISLEDRAKYYLRHDYTMPFHEIPDIRMHEFQMQRIVQALIRYQMDHGELPYDRRGPEYALYQLRNYWPQESAYQKLPKPLEFDETAESVVDLDYLYLNEASVRVLGDELVIKGPFILTEARAWMPETTNLRLIHDQRAGGLIRSSDTFGVCYTFTRRVELWIVDGPFDTMDSLMRNASDV